jgi:hypothetical protein
MFNFNLQLQTNRNSNCLQQKPSTMLSEASFLQLRDDKHSIFQSDSLGSYWTLLIKRLSRRSSWPHLWIQENSRLHSNWLIANLNLIFTHSSLHYLSETYSLIFWPLFQKSCSFQFKQFHLKIRFRDIYPCKELIYFSLLRFLQNFVI